MKYFFCHKSVFWLAFLTAFLYSQWLNSQEVQGPQKILNAFQQELNNTKNEGVDTLHLYAEYIKKLVDRGNFLEVDSILNKNTLGFEAIKDSLMLASIYKDRAYMYKVQGRYDKALEDYLWLKIYYEKRNSYPDLFDIYSLMAEYYRAIRKYNLCNNHLLQAKSLLNRFTPNASQLAYWYSRKSAWSAESLGVKDSVLYYANEGLKLASKTNDVHTQALLLNELGFSAMNSLMDRDIVLNFFSQSRDLLYENERYRDYVEVVNNIAIYHYRYGSMEEATRILEGILQLEEDNSWYGPMQVTYDYLTGLYRDTGNKDKSIDMREKSLLTSIKNIQSENRIKVSDLALGYEKDLANKNLQVQEQKTKVAQKEASDNRKALIISMVIGVVLLFISFIIFQINLRFRRKNELLSEQRNQIQLTNSELEKSLNQQRLLFKELNHRVKNNLSILTGLIYFQEVAEENDNFKKALSTLRNRIKSMALAHESLYKAEQVEKLDFQNYLDSLFQELKKALSDGNKIKVKIECKGFELDLKQAIPVAMIINELFTNSIKHGYKSLQEGNITVKAYHNEALSIIEYTDDGIGFGNKDADNRTLGLRLVRLLLEQLDAKLIDNSAEKGVSFVIEIPNL